MRLFKLTATLALFLAFQSSSAFAEDTLALECRGPKDQVQYTVKIFSHETTTRIDDEVDGYFTLNVYAGEKLNYQNPRVMLSYSSDEFYTVGDNHLILSNPHQNRGETSYFYLKGQFNTLKMNCVQP